MKEVAVYEAKTRLSELIVDVEAGEQITITRRGVAVARLVGTTTARRGGSGQRQQVAATVASLRAERRGVVLDDDVRAVIEDGRD